VSLGSIVGAEDFEQTTADGFGSLKNPKNFFPRPPNIPIFNNGDEFENGRHHISLCRARNYLQPSDSAALLRLNDGNRDFALLLDHVHDDTGVIQQVVPVDPRDLGLALGVTGPCRSSRRSVRPVRRSVRRTVRPVRRS
jgi:hypothetical protein